MVDSAADSPATGEDGPSLEALARLNAQPARDARAALERCCGSTRWVETMLAGRPFATPESLRRAAEAGFAALGPEDYREAFAHHPEIGANLQELRQKFASTAALSWAEQAGASEASEATLQALAAENRRYRERFGFSFIVCATGKSASEMLAILRARFENSAHDELFIAAAEQVKITRLRLQKLETMSAITSHVLDTSLGQPATELAVSLAVLEAGQFRELGSGLTDADGRIQGLLGGVPLAVGTYRLSFEVGAHYRAAGRATFYERVEIQFQVTNAAQHHHVPLLLSPFGYSTYRGT
jgi:hydroxyisourate hydrolase